MTVTGSPEEFGERFQRILDWYDRTMHPMLDQLRQKYAKNGLKPDSQEAEDLEYQVRAYVIDGLLTCLNWRILPDVNVFDGILSAFSAEGMLIVEASLRNRKNRSIRLDYLGIESQKGGPLLAVETKRPGDLLPMDSRTGERPTHELAYSRLIIEGITDPSVFDAQWKEWIPKLCDYVRTIHDKSGAWPRRAVITNGEWLIVFTDPMEVFRAGGKPSEKSVIVIESIRDLAIAANRLFTLLAFQNLIDDVGPLSPVQLIEHVSASDIKSIMFGVRVTYGRKGGWLKAEPTIYVHPMVLVRTTTDGWLRVLESDQHFEDELPYAQEDLERHLAAIKTLAAAIISSIAHYLKVDRNAFVLRTLDDHYSDVASFSGMRTITGPNRSIGSTVVADWFDVVTGEHTHYLLFRPRINDCPYHDHVYAQSNGLASTPSPAGPENRIALRSFFPSGSEHYCAHRHTLENKTRAITKKNRRDAGCRSGEDGDAFCEVFALDRHLCCQTCVFLDVCSKSGEFRLPCQA